MNIITSLPKYSDGQIYDALIREIKTGFQLEKETQRAREAKAAAEAKELQGSRSVPGLGRCIGVIPEREFFRLTQKYGHAEVHSRDFMKYYQKKFPHLSPVKI